MIDELTDSTQLEEYPAADLKEAESVRSRIHLSNFAFLESVLANGPLTAEQIQDVTHHVTSIMYAQLIASPSPSNPKGMHPAAAIRVLGETAPLLARLMDVYIGQDPKVAPMLAYDINRVFDSVFGWTDEEE